MILDLMNLQISIVSIIDKSVIKALYCQQNSLKSILETKQ